MQTLLPALALALLPIGAQAPARAANAASPALERGLAAIEEPKLRADLFFLADDAMKGRDTPSLEQRVAARFIEARMKRLGLQPAGEDGTYFDRYRLGVRQLDLDASELVLSTPDGERRLKFGEDWFLALRGDAGDLDAEGEVVFAGDAEEAELEALGEAARGRWLLCRDTGRRAVQRQKLAQEKGAVGLLVTADESYDKEPYPERFRRVTESLISGQVVSGPGQEPEEPKPAPFPQVYLAPEVGRPLLEGRAVGDVLPLTVRETRRARTEAELENVCALWPGSDPRLARDVIVLSAHYDHVGARGEQIYNGADDNGSGTTGLLGVAEALVAHGPLKRSVLLIWVSGEEKGLFGSQAWAASPTLAETLRPVCNLNVDMIGRNAPDRLGLTPSESHEKASFLSAIARELAPLEGFPRLESADEYYHRSDQASFAKLGIPVCFLFAGEHEDYHKPTDDPDKIDYDKVRRVARLIFRMVVRLDDETL